MTKVLRIDPRSLLGRYAGVRIIPDVHGNFTEFRRYVESARQQRLFVVQLGDVIDRGPDSPSCMNLVHDLHESESGVAIAGNHDYKLYRHLIGNKVSMGWALEETLAQIDSREDKFQVVSKFVKTFASMPIAVHIGGLVMSHGSFHEDLTTADSVSKSVYDRVMYGETDGAKNDEGYPNRTFGWVDSVTPGVISVVGHHVFSMERPAVMTNQEGGHAVFLDCGSGVTGGSLVHIDVGIKDLVNKTGDALLASIKFKGESL